LLCGKLGAVVAEQRAIDAADDRDLLGADDGDVDQMLRPGAGSGLNQAPRLVLVALHAARKMQDDPGFCNSGFNPLACGQVTSHELDAGCGLLVVPTEHADIKPGSLQPRDDQSPRRAGAAGDQKLSSCVSPCHIGCVWGVTFYDT
jgi:hypothetical protein